MLQSSPKGRLSCLETGQALMEAHYKELYLCWKYFQIYPILKVRHFLGHPHVICQLWNSQVNLYLEVGQRLVTKVRLALNSDNKD